MTLTRPGFHPLGRLLGRQRPKSPQLVEEGCQYGLNPVQLGIMQKQTFYPIMGSLNWSPSPKRVPLNTSCIYYSVRDGHILPCRQAT